MSFKAMAGWLVCLAILLPVGAAADVEAAKAAYLRGSAQQKARQYQAAIVEYEASLQAEPRYAYSYKQMGTCYYYLGDKAKAVECYDRYLAAVPNDAAIRKFADSIRGQGSPALVSQPKPFKHFHLTLGSGYSSYAMTDYNKYVADTPFPGSGGSYSPGTVSGGLPMALEASYFLNRNIFAGLSLGYLMAAGTSKFNYSDSFGTVEQTLVANAPAIAFGAVGGYVFPVMKSVDLNLGLEIDFLTLSGANFTTTTTGTGSYASFFSGPSQTTNLSSSGIGGKISAGADWFFTESFSLGTSLGYRMAKLSPISATPPSGSAYDLKNSDDSNFSVDYSGVAFTVGVGYWF